MRKCFFAFVWAALTMQATPISGLPTISVTAATGEAIWGEPLGSDTGTVSANLAGSSFTLNLSAVYPQVPRIPFYFDVTPGDIFGLGSLEGEGRWDLDSSIDNTEISPGGTLVINGVSMAVTYEGGLFVEALASTIVPSDAATVYLPAVLTGDVPVCMAEPSVPNCNGFLSPVSPVFLANVDFDVPGTLTVNFTPSSIGPGLENVFYMVTFTPAPEPRGLLTMTAALLLVGFGRALRVFRTARSS